ncbi:serine/arginine repetitive matrix protein 1-like [Hermetia illucens]|nr:serine/arginine repetitive matrix protein 1-like [Hermetia illucens]
MDRSSSRTRESQRAQYVDSRIRREESPEPIYEEGKRGRDAENNDEGKRRLEAPDESYDDDKGKYGKKRSEISRHSRDDKRSRQSVPEKRHEGEILKDGSQRYSFEETKSLHSAKEAGREDDKNIYDSRAKRPEFSQSTYDKERSKRSVQHSIYVFEKDRSEDGEDRRSAGSSRFEEDIPKAASGRQDNSTRYRQTHDKDSAYSEPKSLYNVHKSKYEEDEEPADSAEEESDKRDKKEDYLEKRIEQRNDITRPPESSHIKEKRSEQSSPAAQQPIPLEGPYYYKVHSRSYVLTDSTLDRICAERAKDRERKNNKKNAADISPPLQGQQEPPPQSKPTTPRNRSRSESPDRTRKSACDIRKEPQFQQSKTTTPRDQCPIDSPDGPRKSFHDPPKHSPPSYRADRPVNQTRSYSPEQGGTPEEILKMASIQHHSENESSDRRHSSNDERPQAADYREKPTSSRSHILDDPSKTRSDHKLLKKPTADSTKSGIKFGSRYETSDLSTSQYEESSSTDPNKPRYTLQDTSSQKVSELIIKHDLQVAPNTESMTSEPMGLITPPRDAVTVSRYSRQPSGRNVFNSRPTESIKMTKSPFTIASETCSPETLASRSTWRSNCHASSQRPGRQLSQESRYYPSDPDRQLKYSAPDGRQRSPSRTTGGEQRSDYDSSPPNRASSTARSARFPESPSSRSPSVSPQRSSSQKRSPSRIPACGRKNCGALGAVGLSVRSIDVGSIHKVIDELSGRRPSTDFFVSVLPEKIHSKTFRVNIIDKETGDLLGYFYIDEEKFHLARTQGVFDNYLALYVLNSVGSITDFKSTMIPKAMKKYQCLTKCTCVE